MTSIEDFYKSLQEGVNDYIIDELNNASDYSKRSLYSMMEDYLNEEDNGMIEEIFEEMLWDSADEDLLESFEQVHSPSELESVYAKYNAMDDYDKSCAIIKELYYSNWLSECIDYVKSNIEYEFDY